MRLPGGKKPREASDFLDSIRSIINRYYRELENPISEKMFDIERQRDLARECVLQTDNVLNKFRTWRKTN